MLLLTQEDDDIETQEPAKSLLPVDLSGMTERQRELAQDMVPILPLFAQAVCNIIHPEQNSGKGIHKKNSGKRRVKEVQKREKEEEKEKPDDRRIFIVRHGPKLHIEKRRLQNHRISFENSCTQN